MRSIHTICFAVSFLAGTMLGAGRAVALETSSQSSNVVAQRQASVQDPQFAALVSEATAPKRLQQLVSLDANGWTLAAALDEMARQVQLPLIYDTLVSNSTTPITATFDRVTAARAILQMLQHTGLRLEVASDGSAARVRRAEAAEPAVQAGSITGQVTDAETGAVVAGAEVLVEGASWRTLAREDGRYRLAEVTPGTYTVLARRIGYLPERRSVAVEDGQAALVDVALQPTATTLGEIVVTGARLREERLQDVPASIASAGAQTLEDHNITSPTELDLVAPGLTFFTKPGRFGTGPAISIRGINTFTQNSGVQESVGIVLDGIPLSRAKGGSFPNFHDVERTEILRGPQGTLFGKNSSAGLISISTKNPTPDFSAEAALDYSTYGTIKANAAVSGPLAGDVLTGRLSTFAKKQDGFVFNTYDNHYYDDDNQYGVRGVLLYEPSAADKVRLSADYLRQENDGGTQTIRALTPDATSYQRDLAIVGPENDRINGRTSPGRSGNVQEAYGSILRWDHKLGANTLTATTGYRRWQQDADPLVYAALTPLDDFRQSFKFGTEQFSGEVRLASPGTARLKGVIGLFYFRDKVTSTFIIPDTNILDTDGNIVGHLATNYTSDTRLENYAAFGEAEYQLAGGFGLIAGGRVLYESVDLGIVGYPTDPNSLRIHVPEGIIDNSVDASAFIWRVGANWKASRDARIYLTASAGYKGPGFNALPSSLEDTPPVDPERSTSVELGMKSQLFEGIVTLNAAVFQAKYSDYQVQGVRAVQIDGTDTGHGQLLLQNAATLDTRGVEIDLAIRPSRMPHVNMNAAYIDATFGRYDNASCYNHQPVGPRECIVNGNVRTQDLAGERLANTPKWAFNIMGRQDLPLSTGGWNAYVSADYSWRSSVRWDALGNPLTVEGAYGLLGAAMGIEGPAERLGLKVYGQNLADKFHTAGITAGGTVNHFLPIDYSTVVGAEVRVRF